MLKKHKTILIQVGLFIATVYTTTNAGVSLQSFNTVDYLSSVDKSTYNELHLLLTGLWYSVAFLGVLTVHEFGHYFMAKYYKLKVTLPYYIPFLPPLGTMGAMIRLKSPTQSKRQFFDVGIAGPLAGFVAALLLMWYGFTHLPPYQDIVKIHPEYQVHIDNHGVDYAEPAINEFKERGKGELLGIGDNMLFWFFRNYVAPNPDDVPGPFELMHYPFLFASYLSLFFTALNLLPMGQLDGGHILYGLVGVKKHAVISRGIFLCFMLWAGIGLLNPYQPLQDMMWKVPLYGGFLFIVMRKVFHSIQNALMIALGVFAVQFSIAALYPSFEGFHGWLVFGFIIARVIGIDHPRAYIEEPLDTKRIVLGWLSLIVFALCFSPQPFIIEVF